MQCESVEEFARGTDSKSANLSQIPQSSHSHTANTRIVYGELQDFKTYSESTLSDSRSISESAPPVITKETAASPCFASVAKQSTESEKMDCHDSAYAESRNDNKTESTPHANLESHTNSETKKLANKDTSGFRSHRSPLISALILPSRPSLS